jgi:hypothetical protein
MPTKNYVTCLVKFVESNDYIDVHLVAADEVLTQSNVGGTTSLIVETWRV